jgi:hypothetical protein
MLRSTKLAFFQFAIYQIASQPSRNTTESHSAKCKTLFKALTTTMRKISHDVLQHGAQA